MANESCVSITLCVVASRFICLRTIKEHKGAKVCLGVGAWIGAWQGVAGQSASKREYHSLQPPRPCRRDSQSNFTFPSSFLFLSFRIAARKICHSLSPLLPGAASGCGFSMMMKWPNFAGGESRAPACRVAARQTPRNPKFERNQHSKNFTHFEIYDELFVNKVSGKSSRKLFVTVFAVFAKRSHSHKTKDS